MNTNALIVDYQQFLSISNTFRKINESSLSLSAYRQSLARRLGFSSLQEIQHTEFIYLDCLELRHALPEQVSIKAAIGQFFPFYVVYVGETLYVDIEPDGYVGTYPEIHPTGYQPSANAVRVLIQYNDALVFDNSQWRRFVSRTQAELDEQCDVDSLDLNSLWENSDAGNVPTYLIAPEYLHHYGFDFGLVTADMTDNSLKQLVARFMGKSVNLPSVEVLKHTTEVEREIEIEKLNTDMFICDPYEVLGYLSDLRDTLE
ncbi:hypothetical protein [uncultured Photobacterium sp.]|uniref:hypothetical protein n=1 Tax=uncultured Photobacterium sp. TaxID=173973 RepID=UPI0026308B9A|nr:hypothetical protein [uncultured Photobacterium sp.]